MKKVILVMGISGSGKSTVGQALAVALSLPFIDADDFHPRENLLKMSRGEALTDEDRWPWLASLVEYMLQNHHQKFVLACSALKASYRDYLSQRLLVQPILLSIEQSVAEARLGKRKGHFMPKELVQSQLETLEVPREAKIYQATTSVNDIVKDAAAHFQKLI